MAQASYEVVFEGKDRVTGVAQSIGQKANRELEDLQQRQFQSSASARERDLRALDDYYGKVKTRAQAHLEQLSRAEVAAQTGSFKAWQRGESEKPFEQQLNAVAAQRARVGDVLAQAGLSERAEKSKLQEKWAAEDAAMAKTHADQRAADVHRLEAQIFAATHTAREREIQDVRNRSAQLRAQYENDAEMRIQIAQAENAEVAAINERYQERTLGRLLSPRNLHHLVGGLAFTAGLGLAIGTEKAVFASAEASDATMKPGAKLQDILAARLNASEAVGNIANGIPVLDKVFKEFTDLASDRGGLERFSAAAKRSAAELEGVSQVLGQVSSRIASQESGLFGYSGAEQSALGISQGRIRRMGEMAKAQDARDAAQSAYEKAQAAEQEVRDTYDPTGQGIGRNPAAKAAIAEAAAVTAAAKLPLDQAKGYIEALKAAGVREETLERERAEQALRLDSERFNRGQAARMREATARGEYETPEVRRRLEMDRLLDQQASRMERFAGLDERVKDLAKGPEAWQNQYVQDQLTQLAGQGNQAAIDALQGINPYLRTTLKTQVAPDEYQRRLALAAEEQRQKEETEAGNAAERAGLEAIHDREWRDTQRQAEIIRAGASPLESKQRAAERAQQELAGRTEDPAIAQAKQAALEERFRREDEDRERTHRGRMKDFAADASLDREAHRKREMEKIAEGYAEDLRRFADNADRKKEILDEIAAKQTALGAQQERERRGERAGILGEAFRAIGRDDLAERVAQRESITRLREEYSGNQDMLSVIGLMDEAQRIRLSAVENWIPQEAQSRKARWDTGVPSGYDSPMVGMARELTTIRERLDAAASNLGLFDLNPE